MQIALDRVAGAAGQKGNFTMMDNLGIAMNATNIEAYALAKGLDFTWKTASGAEKAEVAMQMFFENTEQYAGNLYTRGKARKQSAALLDCFKRRSARSLAVLATLTLICETSPKTSLTRSARWSLTSCRC